MSTEVPYILTQILPDGTPGRVLTLDGASLPDEWISAPITFREVVSWPPGSTSPVVQKIGIEVKPITLSGEWDEARLGDVARQNHEIAVKLVTDGYDVTLSRDGLFSRRCGVTEYAPEFQGAPEGQFGRLKWKITLAPREVEDRNPDTIAMGALTFGDVEQATREFLERVKAQQAQAEARAKAMSARARAAAGISLAATAADDVRNVLGAASMELAALQSALELPTESLGVVAGTARSVVAFGINAFSATIGAGTNVFTEELPTPSETIDVWLWASDSVEWCRTPVNAGFDCGRLALALSSGGDRVTPYSVTTGDTLQSIAQRELGDWRKWSDIADLNNLDPGAPLTPGVRVVLPSSGSGVEPSADVFDLDVPTWGEPTPVGLTPTGDLNLTSGATSVQRWVVHAAFTTPGTLYGAPTFGAGLGAARSKPITRVAGDVARLVSVLKRDSRILAATATATAGDEAGKVVVTANVTTPDSKQPMQINIVV